MLGVLRLLPLRLLELCSALRSQVLEVLLLPSELFDDPGEVRVRDASALASLHRTYCGRACGVTEESHLAKEGAAFQCGNAMWHSSQQHLHLPFVQEVHVFTHVTLCDDLNALGEHLMRHELGQQLHEGWGSAGKEGRAEDGFLIGLQHLAHHRRRHAAVSRIGRPLQYFLLHLLKLLKLLLLLQVISERVELLFPLVSQAYEVLSLVWESLQGLQEDAVVNGLALAILETPHCGAPLWHAEEGHLPKDAARLQDGDLLLCRTHQDLHATRPQDVCLVPHIVLGHDNLLRLKGLGLHEVGDHSEEFWIPATEKVRLAEVILVGIRQGGRSKSHRPPVGANGQGGATSMPCLAWRPSRISS
mmetsp:Transcript_96210/g.206489  ORF Transcript_96210/g.206489 Transcript_96210/m.206489 type:complete len:360 (+) Transcript_96210:527-1606(+)